MVASFLVFMIFTIILYVIYSSQHNRVDATASVLQRIWSGDCRLSCQRSSGLSGFSGLTGPVRRQNTQGTADVGSNADCICQTCPCGIMLDVINTCAPATSALNTAVGTLSNQYYELLKFLRDARNYVQTVLDCRTSCQRRARLINPENNLQSTDNLLFNYEQGTNKDKTIQASTLFRIKSKLETKSDVKSDESRKEIADKEGSSKQNTGGIKTKTNLSDSDTTLKPNESVSSLADFNALGECSKCKQRGKICIKSCPNSKEKQNARK